MAVVERFTARAGIGVAALVAALAIAACGGSTHGGPGTQTTAARDTPSTAATTGPDSGGAPRHKRSAKSRSTSRSGGSGGKGAKASGRSGPVPAGAVATVAGQPISLAAYTTAYKAQLTSLTSGGIPIDPPTYSRCVAGYAKVLKRFQSKLPKKSRPHIPRVSHAQLLKDCQSRYRGIRQGVMTQLIQQHWTLAAAKAARIVISGAEVSHALASQEKAMGGSGAYAKYLKRTKQTGAQAVASTRLSLMDEALQKRRLGAPVHVSAQQVAAFFHAHHAEFVLPHQKAPKLSTYATRIRLVLQEQVQSRRAQAANLAYERRWRAQTRCAPGYVVSLCANGPG